MINQKLGPMILGYKTRRIYCNCEEITNARVEFRDLIQFAYSLSNEGGSIANETLAQTLIDIQSVRTKFLLAFHSNFQS